MTEADAAVAPNHEKKDQVNTVVLMGADGKNDCCP
jgi:hypothetical protein